MGERRGPLVHRLRLGLADGQGGGRGGLTLGAGRVGLRRTSRLLGLTALGALDRLGLGERGALGLLGLTGEPGLLGVGLGGRDGGGLARLGGGDLGGPVGLRLLLDLVARGVGRLADLGLELALGQRGLPDGDLLLLGQDRLVPVGLGQRAGGVGLGGGGVGLGLDLGLLQRQRPLRDRDLLLGGDGGLLGGLPGVGLGDACGLADARGLGATEVGEVGRRRR